MEKVVEPRSQQRMVPPNNLKDAAGPLLRRMLGYCVLLPPKGLPSPPKKLLPPPPPHPTNKREPMTTKRPTFLEPCTFMWPKLRSVFPVCAIPFW